VIIASQTRSLWLAIALISLACAAHQGWSANIFTLTSDLFPKKAVGSVVGIGGFGGAMGGLLIAKLAGYVLQYYHSYTPMFIIAGITYLAALAIIQGLAPKLTPVKLD
jgi:ACS family hexuronate transporter-like MFS transporter